MIQRMNALFGDKRTLLFHLGSFVFATARRGFIFHWSIKMDSTPKENEPNGSEKVFFLKGKYLCSSKKVTVQVAPEKFF